MRPFTLEVIPTENHKLNKIVKDVLSVVSYVMAAFKQTEFFDRFFSDGNMRSSFFQLYNFFSVLANFLQRIESNSPRPPTRQGDSSLCSIYGWGQNTFCQNFWRFGDRTSYSSYFWCFQILPISIFWASFFRKLPQFSNNVTRSL